MNLLTYLLGVCFFLGLLSQTAYSVNHEDCRCWVENSKRSSCPMGAFLDEEMCTTSGCCFHTSKTVTVKPDEQVTQCYLPLDSCHEIKQCQIMSSERRACPHGQASMNTERVCKRWGCCYNPTVAPYCYRAEDIEGAVSSPFDTQTPPPPARRLIENDPTVGSIDYGQNEETNPIVGKGLIGTDENDEIPVSEEDEGESRDENEKDDLLPKETIRDLISARKLSYRCPDPMEEQVSCGDDIYTKEECMSQSCCWVTQITKKSISGYICVHAVITKRNMAEKPTAGHIPKQLTSEWKQVLPEAFGSEDDEQKLSMKPQTKYEYPDFSVSLQCPNPFDNLMTYLPCEANNRHDCIAKKCCWVYHANSNSEYASTCLTARAKYDNFEIFQQFSNAEDIPVEILTTEIDAGYWVPGEPVQLFTTPNNITVRLSCPANENHSQTCGSENILKDECLASGCCWLPQRLFSNKNFTSPCFASVVTLADQTVNEEDDWGLWNEWTKCKPLSPCSKDGFKIQTRECSPEAKANYGHCDGVSEIISTCDDFNECGEAKWTDWTRWSICSSTCAAGFRFRVRKCSTPEGLETCLSDYQQSDLTQSESEPCNVDKCTLWSDWETTTPCEESCTGGGVEIKSRQCLQFSSMLQFLRDVPISQLKSIPLTPPAININFDLSLNHEEECYLIKRPCNASGVCLPYWGDWKDWSECMPTCDDGVSERVRYCYLDNQNGPQVQNPIICRDLFGGEPYETRSCNFDTCDGWGPWEAEGECDSDCGQEGVIKTMRQCFLPGPRLSILPDSCFEQYQQCAGKPCYTWTEYSDWSDCSSSCSPGEMMRYRICVDGKGNEVEDISLCSEGPSEEIQACNEDMCNVWGRWNEGDCPTACFQSGESLVTRKCLNAAIDMSVHPNMCYQVVEPCIKDCSYDWENWTEWSSCPDSCTQGLRNRTRKCLREDGVMVDPGVCGFDMATQTKTCHEGQCVTWDDWETTKCMGSCDEGIVGYKTETRQCISENAGFIEESCYSKTVACQLSCDIKWGDWKEWSVCSNGCSPGIQTRPRDCFRGNLKVDSKICSSAFGGSNIEIIPCNEEYCSDWTEYETIDFCRARCNRTVTRNVFRSCNHNLSSEVERKISKCFFKQAHCTGDCKPRLGIWALWEPCEDRCGPSIQRRHRICYFDGAIANASVCADSKQVDSIMETRSCNTHMCTRWGAWSASTCSQPCYGTHQLARQCIGEGDIADTSCYNKEESCGPEICPFQYTEWSEWTKCGMECSPGDHSRTRSCKGLKNNTLLLSKCAFLGPSKETQPCNTGYCRRWMGWTANKCSLNCGGEGFRTRTRKCDSKEMTDREMQYRHTRKCYKITNKCTSPECEGDWTNWLSWTECSKSCGPGVRSKVRQCIKKGTRNTVIDSNKCSGGNNLSHEKDKCNRDLCLIWSEWKNSDCTVTCGKDAGSYIRTRICRSANDKTAPGLRKARGGDLCYKRKLWCDVKPCF